MKTYSTLLFATDFSECSKQAVESVVSLCKLLGARLHLLHVVEAFDIYANRYGTEQVLYYDMMKQMRTGANEDLERLTAEITASGVTVTPVIREGKASEEIVRYASDHNISLLCISTHGWSGLKHMMLGSTTEKVIRQAPCPVFVVRCPTE